MEYFKEGTICPHRTDEFKVGCFCEFCDYVATIDTNNNVQCQFNDIMEEEE